MVRVASTTAAFSNAPARLFDASPPAEADFSGKETRATEDFSALGANTSGVDLMDEYD